MSFRQKLDALYAKYKFEYFGIAGSAITATCMLITALGFTGYSVVNHAISELGMASVSPLAAVFNIGLIIGGIVFLFFAGGMRAALDSRLARLSRITAYVTAVGTSLVGVFPGDVNFWGHLIAAQTFFFGGMLMVLGFSLAIFRQKDPRIGKWLCWVGLVVVAIFTIFVIILQVTMASYTFETMAGMLSMFQGPRPAFIPLTFFEWSCYFGVITWLCLFALDSLRKRR
jgi:hypothetical membrane protein